MPMEKTTGKTNLLTNAISILESSAIKDFAGQNGHVEISVKDRERFDEKIIIF
jgi:hypothetical protein